MLFISKLIEILHWVLECSSLLLRVVAKSFYLIHKKLNLSEFGCFNKYYKIEEFSAIRGTENIKKKVLEKNNRKKWYLKKYVIYIKGHSTSLPNSLLFIHLTSFYLLNTLVLTQGG